MNAMSIISTIVGAAAASSFAFGPLIHGFVSVKNMFLYSAILIFIAWIIIVIFLKDSRNINVENSIATKKVLNILIRDKSFVALNLGIFINNFIMTGVFFTIPQYLENITGVDGMWKIFMPTVIIAIIIMRIAVKKLDNLGSIKFLIAAFILSGIGMLFYFNKDSFVFIFLGTLLFMISYISIGTIVPTLANSILKDEYRGIGNGIINSLQYVGSFIGSIVVAAIWVESEKIAFILIAIIGLLGGLIIKLYVNGERFDEK